MLRRFNNYETLLYTLALIAALSVRLLNLGVTPLSDAEATWALQAARVGRALPAGYDFSIGPQPAYTTLTGLTFALLGLWNFAARFWPALAGALLVLAPLAFRRQLGRVGALALAFGLAIDPGLAAVSRQAGGPMLALALSLLAAALWQTRRKLLAGTCAGLALAAGPAILAGLLAVGLAVLLARFLRIPMPFGEMQAPAGTPDQRMPAPEAALAGGATAYPLPGANETAPAIPDWEANPEAEEAGQPHFPAASEPAETASSRKENAWLPLGAMLLTAVLAASAFWLAPQGLGAWFGILPAYFSGWVSSSGIPASRLLAALVFYNPLALVLAIAALVRGFREWNAAPESSEKGLEAVPGRPALFFGLWAGMALMLAILRPGRQVADLVWVLVPLLVLAAGELSHYLPEADSWPAAPLQALLVFVLTGLAWYSLASTIPLLFERGTEILRYTLAAGIVILIALTTVLVSLGWSARTASRGLVWGLTAAGLIYVTAWMWGAAQARLNAPEELWSAPPATGDSDLLTNTLTQLSTWSLGNHDLIDVVVTADSPALRWALRDFRQAKYGAALAPDSSPAVVIVWKEAEPKAPSAAASYRGETFNWEVRPGWKGALPEDVLKWFTYRDAPLAYQQVILWARSDLFPGSNDQPQTANPPVQ